MTTTEVTLFYLGEDDSPFRYGPYVNRDDAVKAQQGNNALSLSEFTFPLNEDVGVIRLPSLPLFTELTKINDSAETMAAYKEFIGHYRATNADFEGWWKANKTRYVIDVDGAVEQLRKMLES